MFRTSGSPPRFDAEGSFAALPLEEARSVAAEVAQVLCRSVPGDPFDAENGHRTLADALISAWPEAGSRDLTAMLDAIAASARSLAAARWRMVPRDGGRPDTPQVDARSVRDALLIHLHGTPDGPVAALCHAHYAQHARTFASRRWRVPPPTEEALRELTTGIRERDEALLAYVQELDAS